MADDVLFSLVIATVGEARGLDRLLRSLKAQSWQKFDIIVVDQNEDDRLNELIATYNNILSIKHVRCEKGLSRARNIGLAASRAQYVGFPDDDCWYQPTFVERVHLLFAKDPELTGLTGLCLDETGQLAAGGGSRRAQVVTKQNVWGLGVSATLFLRRSIVETVGGFDESLGLGAKTDFQSGEETDLLLRIIAAGHRVRYEPRLVVHHPAHRSANPVVDEAKAWHYGVGMGRVLRLHDYSAFEILRHLVKPALGALAALSVNERAQARVRWARARGRLRGLLYEKPTATPPSQDQNTSDDGASMTSDPQSRT